MEEKKVWPAATWWPTSFVVASGEWVEEKRVCVCVWRRDENREESCRVVVWSLVGDAQ